MKPEFLELLLPVYKKLSEISLLERCTHCLTQNSNESLHRQIWKKCPKDTFSANEFVEAAAGVAICEYNYGYEETMNKILQKCRLSFGKITIAMGHKKDVVRMKLYEKQRTEVQKKIRSAKRLDQTKAEAEKQKEEGPSYSAGGF